MRPGAERNLSGWQVLEAVSEISAAEEGRLARANKPSSSAVVDNSAFTQLM